MSNVTIEVHADTSRGYSCTLRHVDDPHIDATVYQYNGWEGNWNRAGINWSAYGTKSPEFTNLFVEVLQAAIQLANERNELTGAK